MRAKAHPGSERRFEHAWTQPSFHSPFSSTPLRSFGFTPEHFLQNLTRALPIATSSVGNGRNNCHSNCFI